MLIVTKLVIVSNLASPQLPFLNLLWSGKPDSKASLTYILYCVLNLKKQEPRFQGLCLFKLYVSPTGTGAYLISIANVSDNVNKRIPDVPQSKILDF